MNKILVFLMVLGFVFCFGSSLIAEEESAADPIDQALEKCIERDFTNAGMTSCQQTAYDSWDRELNKVYGELMRKLPENSKQTLKAAQTEWLKFRDSEFQLIDKIYEQLQGTVYIPVRVADRAQIIEDRVLILRGYLANLEKE